MYEMHCQKFLVLEHKLITTHLQILPLDCPNGPGQSPMGGHSVDFNREGEQWSPVFGSENNWVMIGQKYENSATTCYTHRELEGGSPSWGLTNDNFEAKRFIQCCSF